METELEKQVKVFLLLHVSNRPNSSEEKELERIRNLQKEVALHRKKNEASYKAALAGSE